MDAADKIAAARVLLIREYPYLATAVSSVHSIETKLVPTMGVDEYWRLYWNPDFLDRIEVMEAAAVLVHEIIHLLRKHPERGRALHNGDVKLAELTNTAADIPINEDIAQDGVLPLPGNPDTCKLHNVPPGLTLEEYYAIFKARADQAEQEKPKPGEGDPGDEGDDDEGEGGSGKGDGEENDGEGDEGGESEDGDQGESDGDSDGSGDDAGADESGEGERDGAGGADGEDQGEAPNAGRPGGSAGDGFKRPWELPPPTGEDDPGMGQEEQELVRNMTAAAIREAGTCPAMFKRWAEEPPKRVDIRSKVRNALSRGIQSFKAGTANTTFAQVRRRAEAYQPLILPGARSRILAIDVIVDTSGSIGDDELALAMAGIHDVTREFDVEVVSADTCIASANKIFTGQSITALKGNLKGGGGTDMATVIVALDNPNSAEAKRQGDFIKRGRRRPDIIICITDGYTPWPGRASRAKLFVVLVMESYNNPPSWSKVIRAY